MFIPDASLLSCGETPVLEQGFTLKGVRSIFPLFEHGHMAVMCCFLNRGDFEHAHV